MLLNSKKIQLFWQPQTHHSQLYGQCNGNTQLNPPDVLCYLVGPFVGLQELAVQGGFVLHRVKAQEPTVVQGVVL